MLKDTFCPSPWFHLRLLYNGDFKECRWFGHESSSISNISTTSIMEFYNSQAMKSLRTELLAGECPSNCSNCYYEDKFDKLSGRRKQLLKSGINNEHFELSARSSPHYQEFLHSMKSQGHSNMSPVDLQIDLGNTCNSACIMCSPSASSRLHTEYVKLHKINPTLFKDPVSYKSWIQNPALVDKFVNELVALPSVKYIHFLGGETLYIEAFYTLCEKLIEAGVSKNIIVGTTTNGTIYDQRLEHIISNFKEFHLGLSIEAVTQLNDYVRYPCKISGVMDNFDKFLKLRETTNLQISLRITPNVFTIYEIDQVFEYMIANNVIAESCNILFDPDCLRIELLPDDIRQEVLAKIDAVIARYNINKTNIVNIRRSDLVSDVIANVIVDYRNFIANYTVPDKVDYLRYKLIDFLKSFEYIRQNSILDYAPRYKDFLKSYGY